MGRRRLITWLIRKRTITAGALCVWMLLRASGYSASADTPNRRETKGATAMGRTMREPDIETALGWWPEYLDKWTPIGWKDHMFRFNVLHNGTISVEPFQNKRTARWAGQGFQIEFNSLATRRDDCSVVQGWDDCAAPVLWSEYSQDGFLIRQEIFAHVPGSRDTVTGVEPLYAWVRLSIHKLLEGPKLPKTFRISLTINAPDISVWMSRGTTLTYDPNVSVYPRPLAPDRPAYDSAQGYRLVEGDGRVRLGIAAGQTCQTAFQPRSPADKDSEMSIELPAKLGAHADLLLPMLPTDRVEFDRELSVGFNGALAEADRYWSKKPPTAATFDCPEDYVDDAIRQQVRSAGIIAERNPDTGICSLLTGSWLYTLAWATPNSMAAIMSLDTMGYHADVDRYLDVFRREQGTVVPPGGSFKLHPGYLSTPASLRSVNWLTDHGAILWAISEHVLLAGGKERAEKWLPTIIRACEFIRDARAIRGHGGVPGLMPPAVATDQGVQVQGVWNDGWNYKGLVTAVRLLHRLHHPRAAEFEAEAHAYRTAFLKAIRARAAAGPKWTDSKGKRIPFAPFSMSGDTDTEVRHPFYLDGGPLFLVFSELMDADDPLMKATLRWFREGPQTRFLRPDGSPMQVPCLVHEMSTCEPCYSWNVFHSHQLGDRARFLEGMYSEFAGAYSHQTFTACECRGGISGICACTPAPYLARLAVVDDQAAHGDLHLLRLTPLAWLLPGRESRFERIPTEYGPVSLHAGLDPTGRELLVTFQTRFRDKPRKIFLHIPPVRGLTGVQLNGRRLPWSGQDRIEIRP